MKSILFSISAFFLLITSCKSDEVQTTQYEDHAHIAQLLDSAAISQGDTLPINIEFESQNNTLLNHKTMNKGIVKFFNEAKGFGFIKDEATGKEYFVHTSGLTEKVRENDVVTFDIIDGKKGQNAVNVRKV